MQARKARPVMFTWMYRSTTYVRLLPALASLCLITALGCSKESSAEPPVQTRPAGSASAAAPTRAAAGKPAEPPARKFFEVSGVASPARTATLAPKGSGVLRSIKVREGDRVKSGDVLAVLDATDLAIRAQAAQVAHAQALAAYENAKDDMNRAGQLFDAGALPDQSMEKVKLGMRIAELQVQAAQVGIRMSQQALADATLRAPFSGVITRVIAEEGNYITVMPPSPIFVLADTDFLEVRASVPERKLSQLKKGMPVVVTLPALNVTRDAKIDRLSDVVDPMTRSLEIVVRIDNKDHDLPAGLFARVSFPSISADDGSPDDSEPPAPAARPAASTDQGGR